MLKKRLVGVITVKDGWAVQSFGYSRYLPLGRVEPLAENLDRWGVDEILLINIDRTRNGLGPDLALLRRVGELGLATPLTYGGGVHTPEDAAAVVHLGADRLCVDASLADQPARVRQMSALVGAQALIASLPAAVENGRFLRHDYRTGALTELTADSLPLLLDGVVSEALVIDYRHEGQPDGFDMNLITGFPVEGIPLIAFGGISEPAQLSRLFNMPSVAAVAVGNFLSYREHEVQRLRSGLVAPIRERVYASEPGL